MKQPFAYPYGDTQKAAGTFTKEEVSYAVTTKGGRVFHSICPSFTKDKSNRRRGS